MSKKSRRKYKRKRQKGPPMLKQPTPKTNDHSLKKEVRLLEVLGLLLTALGLIALIELFPRLSASPSSQIDQLTPVFNVSNDGYLRVTDVKSACFLWHVATTSRNTAESSLSQDTSPPNNILAPAERFPVPCRLRMVTMFESNPRFTLVDLAIVVYYRPWPFTMFRMHKLIRFAARPGPNGSTPAWDQLPASALEKDFEKSHFGSVP
jgi:hypothetical protein